MKRGGEASSIRQLAAHERGTSVVEFGFVAPFLCLLLAGIVDLSAGLSERFSLQQAIGRSFEMIQAKPAEAAENTAGVNWDFLRNEAAAAADVPVGQVTLTKWLECDGVEKGYTDDCTAGQEVARYVRLTITKDFVGKFYLATFPMSATSVVRIQ
jgi:Flp pilus assembly protein TadG